METSADVVVVGAGPVGLLSALLLAKRGHQVVVIEKWPKPYPLPRAVGLSHDTLHAFQIAGLIDDIRPHLRFTADGSRTRELCAGNGEVLLRRFDRATSCSGWPERCSFSQPEFETALDAAVRSHPAIEILRGWSVTSSEARSDGVTVHADAFPSDGPATLQASGRYVLGCDGANSVVRGDDPNGMVDLGFSYDWLVVDVVVHEPLSFHPNLGQILGPPRPTTMVIGGPNSRRWEFMRLDDETVEDLNRPETAWRLLAPFGVHPANASLQRHAVYTFGGRWARRWHDNRQILAGDAAHLMPPFLGEGLNSGVRDAIALAWQLDLVLKGLAPEQLLDTYSDERRGHVEQIVSDAVELGRIICVTDPDDAADRDEQLRASSDHKFSASPTTGWRLGPGTWLEQDPYAGYLGIQGRVQKGEATGLLDDLLGGNRFVLLSPVGDPRQFLTGELAERWATLNGLSIHVGSSSAVRDIDGTYAAWFGDRQLEIALLRPDFYVFGTDPSIRQSARLVEALLERLKC